MLLLFYILNHYILAQIAQQTAANQANVTSISPEHAIAFFNQPVGWSIVANRRKQQLILFVDEAILQKQMT